MRIRFNTKEELLKELPYIKEVTKSCFDFLTQEIYKLPIYPPLFNYENTSQNPKSLGQMNVQIIPEDFKIMISTGDYVPVIQIKLIITNMIFINDDYEGIFDLFSDRKKNYLGSLNNTHFLRRIETEIINFLKYCNMRKFSYKITEIQWED